MDQDLKARRRAAYQPHRRFPGAQPGNRNALKHGAKTRAMRERQEFVRVFVAEAKFRIALARPFFRDRRVYAIERGGVVEHRVYEVRRIMEANGARRRKWFAIEADGGLTQKSPNEERKFASKINGGLIRAAPEETIALCARPLAIRHSDRGRRATA